MIKPLTKYETLQVIVHMPLMNVAPQSNHILSHDLNT